MVSYAPSTGSSNNPINVMGTLDPNQTALAEQLKNMLANWSTGNNNYLASMTDFLKGAPSMLPDSIKKALESAMSGKVSEEYYQSTVAAPALKTFQEDIAPGIREEFVGPGTAWGGARAEAVSKGASNLAGSLAAARGGMAQEALQRGTTAALGYGGLLTQNLGNWMNAFVAANPSYKDTIDSIIAYLNTPTQLAYQNPEYIPSAIKAAMKPQPTKKVYSSISDAWPISPPGTSGGYF